MLETLNHNNPNAVEQELDSAVSVSEEERQEVAKIMKRFYQYKKYRSRYDKRWMDYYKFFRGEHWSDRRPRWKSSEIVNLVWQVIQSQVPLQTDVRPKFSFLPTEPTDLQFANILEKVSDSDWEKNNWMMVVLETLYDAWIYGTGHSSMGYDATANYGIGCALFKSEDPFYCYPCPDSNNINDSESEGFFYARPIATDRLKQKYPKRADDIKADVVDFARKERTNLQAFSTNYFNSDREMPEGNYGGSYESSDIPRTFVVEAFLKPATLVEDENDVEDESGTIKKEYTVRKKYPNGRHVVIANNMILLDEELPYEDNLIPFSKMVNYILPREYFGVSEIEQLEGPQRIFNKFLCFALDAWALTGNPVWICDTNAGIDSDEGIINVPGSIIEKNPGTEVRQVQGVGMNPALMPFLDRLVGWFNSVAGQSSDLSQGDAPGGVTAASAIEQLVRIARTRVRQKQRNLDSWLSDVGRQYINRVFQFYDVPKIYRITNDDGSQVFMRFRMEKNEKGERVAVKSEFGQNPSGKIIEGPEETLIVKGNFDISVKTGSDLPFEQGDVERKALALFDRGIIDAEEVLERLEIPNRDRILTRMMERQQQAAQQQQPQG